MIEAYEITLTADAVAERAQDAGDVSRARCGGERVRTGADKIDSLTNRSRLGDQLPGARHIRRAPGAVGAGVQRVRAVAAVAGYPGRDRLAGRGREGRAAVELGDLGAVDRVVERLPDAQVVERRTMGVERQEVHRPLRVVVQLGRVLKLELAGTGLGGLAVEPVGASPLDRGHGGLQARGAVATRSRWGCRPVGRRVTTRGSTGCARTGSRSGLTETIL